MAGIYGVMAHSVAGRTREIGIRMAFGPQTGGVMRLVLVKGMSLVGFRLGLAGARAIAHLPANLLFEVKPADSTAFIGAFIALLCVAFVAKLRARTPRHAHLSLDRAAIRITIP
jgi:ABC-type antimicrobial peptide transport system permease subunit